MRNLLAILFFCLSFVTYTQELNCKIQILSPSIQQSPENVQLLDAFKNAVFEMMNNTKWTDEIYKDHEKIECNLIVTVNSIKSLKNFNASFQVSSGRPVFNTNYLSPLVNFVDKGAKGAGVNFTYELGQPLAFSPSVFRDQLSSVLAFYAYYVIGMDRDSYELEGGTPYFTLAQNIVSQAQSTGNGWTTDDNNNRAWIIENVLNAQFKDMRKSVYEYHRMGFDVAYDDTKKALEVMTRSMTYLQGVHVRQPNSLNMKIYFNAKSDEVVNVWSEAERQQKSNVFNIVRRIDPGNLTKYQQMIRR